MRGAVVLPFLILLVVGARPGAAREDPPVAAARASVEETLLAPPPAPPRPGRSVAYEDWMFWYHANADRLEAEAAGGERLVSRPAGTALCERILASLRRLVDDRARLHPFVAAQAVRALARVTHDVRGVKRLIRILLDPAEHILTREAASLGLGLLRRTDATYALPATACAQARETLFTALSEPAVPSRTRALAALSIGLLAEGAAAEPGLTDDGLAAARKTTDRLFHGLKDHYVNQDIHVGLLVAIGLQPRGAVTQEQRRVLSEAATRGRLYKSGISDILRAHAALALGRVGAGGDLAALEQLLATRRGVGKSLRRSAVVAWCRLARRCSNAEREEAIRRILALQKGQKDLSTKHFLTMGLVPLVVAGALESEGLSLLDAPGVTYLRELTTKGTFLERPYGALALGLVLRELAGVQTSSERLTFRKRSLAVLRKGLSSTTDPRSRAAFVLALGLAGDEPSREARARMAADPRRETDLRAYTLLGLALGRPDDATLALAVDQWRSPDGIPHVLTLRAMGIVASHQVPADPGPFLEALVREKSAAVKAEASVTLGRLASPDAVERLIAIAHDPSEQDLTRGMAVLALGRMADPEPVPSLVRLYESVQHRCMTDLTNELMSTL